MGDYKYDTQLLLEGENLNEDVIGKEIEASIPGDCLLVVGDEELLKIHYHTNEPWDLIRHCSLQGEIFDIVIEDMDRQSRGLKG
ncbi:kinase to dihydroxyacetone kinase [Culicoidibacter larvae]|uniref:Kinase to dihydroxyacetone kinase n=1 Tax=Culicoidibacter larvae TaxID=2579976 RepID=A0A5R8QEP5_9FIRM|nr:kinase to dihydroxyacetone kinase [Culicoidibacter larvae]